MRPAKRKGGYHEGSTVHRSSSCFAVFDIRSQISSRLPAGSGGVNFPDSRRSIYC